MVETNLPIILDTSADIFKLIKSPIIEFCDIEAEFQKLGIALNRQQFYYDDTILINEGTDEEYSLTPSEVYKRLLLEKITLMIHTRLGTTFSYAQDLAEIFAPLILYPWRNLSNDR